MSNDIAVMRKTLTSMSGQFQAVLPTAGIPVDRLIRTTLNALQANPSLLACSTRSLIAQTMVAAWLGLEPDGVLGHGWLVPYKGSAVFVPGYRGYILLADNAGWTLEARVVRERDRIVLREGTVPVLEHEPFPFGSEEERGRIIGAYARARAIDRPALFVTLPVEEIDAIRDASQGYKAAVAKGRATPWRDHYAAMAEKTAIRRLAKSLPLAVQRAAAVEVMADRGNAAKIVEGELVEDALADDAHDGEAEAGGGALSTLDRIGGEA